MSRFRLEPDLHLLKNTVNTFQVDLAMESVEYFHEPAHVCTLELVGEIYVHVDRGHGFLSLPSLVQDRDWVRDVFYPDLLDVDPAVITLSLDIFHVAHW